MHVLHHRIYVGEILQTFLEASNEELECAAKHLKASFPPAMVTILEKQPRKEALEKRDMRKGMVVKDIPPTPGKIKCQYNHSNCLLCITHDHSLLCYQLSLYLYQY